MRGLDPFLKPLFASGMSAWHEFSGRDGQQNAEGGMAANELGPVGQEGGTCD